MIDIIVYAAVFPGYYTGRALHIHTRVFTEWTPLSNGSFEPSRLSHTGQFFFDDDLVETTSKVVSLFHALSLRLTPHLDVALLDKPYQGYLGTYAQLGRLAQYIQRFAWSRAEL